MPEETLHCIHGFVEFIADDAIASLSDIAFAVDKWCRSNSVVYHLLREISAEGSQSRYGLYIVLEDTKHDWKTAFCRSILKRVSLSTQWPQFREILPRQ